MARCVKAVILVGGDQKGTRFRPLSLDIPKILFPVAGKSIILHHIEAVDKIDAVSEIILLGFYQPDGLVGKFLETARTSCSKPIRYLQEYASLGTGGGLYHFRDLIFTDGTQNIILINGDVCSNADLNAMLEFHRSKEGALVTILATDATKSQSVNYGCIIENPETMEVEHYVEKPETFVSSLINCGMYIVNKELLPCCLRQVFLKKQHSLSPKDIVPEINISFEHNILTQLPNTGKLFVFRTKAFWSQVKHTGAVIYANKHYLEIYKSSHPELLATKTEFKTMGNVFVHPTAKVDSSVVLGPNVSIGKNVEIGPGVRIKDSIILDNVSIHSHACILYAIIGWNSTIGPWTRIEGSPDDPNPNKPFAKLDIQPLFSDSGKLNPSITVIGSNSTVHDDVFVLNSIVLPHKELSHDCKNQILL